MGKSIIRVIFFGTSEFAVPTLEALFNAGPVRSGTDTPSHRISNGVNYEIVAVITQPDKPAGRKKVLTPPPVKLKATSFKLKVLQPISLRGAEFLKNLQLVTYNLKPDLGIVAAYGKLIPPEIFNLPKHGLLNIHPSLLPKYRGPSPIQTAILNGDTETGVTIMKVDEEMDHGEIVATYNLQLTTYNSYQEVHDQLAKLGAELLIKTLPDYLAGKIRPVPQDHSGATFTKKFTATDGEIKPDETAEQTYNKVRALNPEPGTYIWIKKNNEKTRLKILEADMENGRLQFKKVQLEGSKPMTLKEFLTGRPYFKDNLLQYSYGRKNS